MLEDPPTDRSLPSRETVALVESVKDYAILMLDTEGRILTWNEGARAIKGWSADEILGQSFTRFYTAADLASNKPRRLLDEAVASGRVEDEGWRVRKDGTQFWADVVITALRDERGGLRGFVKVVRDLTERRAAEEQLRQSEERIRLLVDSVKDYAIFMLDPEGRIASWNSGAERMKGWSASEVIGRDMSIFYPADAGATPAELLRIATSEGRVEHEGWRVRKDGTQFWADVVISRMDGDDGRLLGFSKVTRDLTERRRTAQRLESHARQQAAAAALGVDALRARDPRAIADRVVRTILDVLDADLVAVLTREDDGIRQECSPPESPDGSAPGTAGTGASLRMVAGSGWRDGTLGSLITLDPTTLAGRAHAHREVVIVSDFEHDEQLVPSTIEREHGARSGVAVVIPAPSGAATAHGVLLVLRRAPHAPDEEVSFLQGLSNVIAAAVARDHDERQVRIAERSAAEQRTRSEQAQQELRQRDEFISIAAHELRTPLNALQLNLYSLSSALGDQLSERARTRIGGALRQTQRLSHLISRLLDVSRIVSGTIEIVPERVDLASLASEVVDALRETALRAGSEVVLETRGEITGDWDRTRLEQITTNLLANAINYGGGKAIEVCVDGDAARARLTVRDHGIGIAPEDVDRIFGRFERAVPVRHYGGLGLGLYIAQHIVDAHGGTIRVESVLGEGARFVVELPRTPHETAVSRAGTPQGRTL